MKEGSKRVTFRITVMDHKGIKKRWKRPFNVPND
jgi:hypothetical protein